MAYDVSKLTQQDYEDLHDAVAKIGAKVRFWYAASNIFLGINADAPGFKEILDKTGAQSDYEKHKDHMTYIKSEGDYARKGYASIKPSKNANLWQRCLGFRDIEICVHNPKNTLHEINIKGKKGKLVQIDGNGWGNSYDARVNLEQGYAYIDPEDQDIAHRLGLWFSPAKTLDITPIDYSTHDTHKGKERKDAEGNTVIYCDNMACRERIRNPELYIEEKTGGVYHGTRCMEIDTMLKSAAGLGEIEGKRISLDEAVRMYESGLLQQSPNNKKDPNLRKVNILDAGAISFMVTDGAKHVTIIDHD